jgi:hypothetical protein
MGREIELIPLFASIGSQVSQKQYRHIKGRPEWISRGRPGYFDTLADAQEVLDAAHSGRATILGTTGQGNIVVEYAGVTGYNNNPGVGFINQMTHKFMIKGTKSPSVVPISPGWTP